MELQAIETMMAQDNNLALEAILGFLALAWTLFRGSEWFGALLEGRKTRKWALAVEALESGVEHTWRNYVRALKKGNEDGKLTPEERASARMMAKAAAMELADGINIRKVLGGNLEKELELAVRRMKAMAENPDPVDEE